VAALVWARQHGGKAARAGPCGKGIYDAVKLGLMEDHGQHAELNLRGQDVADEAIALARRRA
jgi:hypothetical protein